MKKIDCEQPVGWGDEGTSTPTVPGCTRMLSGLAAMVLGFACWGSQAHPNLRVTGCGLFKGFVRCDDGKRTMRDRRADVMGGTYFFTVNLAERKRRLLVDHINPKGERRS